MNQEQLNKILSKHNLWIDGGTEGIRADLSGADLRWADLSGADLQYCVEGPCKSEALIEYVPVVHGSPVYHNRPARYEHYEMVQQTENGEPLYKRQYYILHDNPVAYCSECGKRMCSRFTSFCPNCGAKMDGGD